MPDNFAAGEMDAEAAAPPIETMGARYGIRETLNQTRPQVGVQERLTEPYLMPSVQGRNGSMEKVDPAITLTPLGGMMPGPAMPPPQVVGYQGAHPCSDDGAFGSGVLDAWPEGPPVPLHG